MKTGKKIGLGTAALVASLFAAPAYAQHERRQTVSVQPPMTQPMTQPHISMQPMMPVQSMMPVDGNVQRILLDNGHMRGPARGIPAGTAAAPLMEFSPDMAGYYLGGAFPRHALPRVVTHPVIAGTNLSASHTIISVNAGFGYGFGAPLFLPFSGGIFWQSGLPYWWCNFPVPGISYGGGGYYLPFMPAYRQYYRGDMREYENLQRRYESAPESSRRLEERIGELEKKIEDAYRRGREEARREYEARPAAPVPEMRAPAVPEERLAVREIPSYNSPWKDGEAIPCEDQMQGELAAYLQWKSYNTGKKYAAATQKALWQYSGRDFAPDVALLDEFGRAVAYFEFQKAYNDDKRDKALEQIVLKYAKEKNDAKLVLIPTNIEAPDAIRSFADKALQRLNVF